MTEENIAHIQRLTALSKTNRFIASQVITLVFCMLKYINIEYQSHFHPNNSYRVLGQLPLGQLPLGQLPWGQLPRGQLPLRKITPIGQLPLCQLPTRTTTTLGPLPLRTITPRAITPIGRTITPRKITPIIIWG